MLFKIILIIKKIYNNIEKKEKKIHSLSMSLLSLNSNQK